MKPATRELCLPFIVVPWMLAACSSTPGPPDAGTSGFGFSPSNVDLSTLDFSGVGDLVVSHNLTWETDHGGVLGSDDAGTYRYQEQTQSGLAQLTSSLKLGVFTVNSLTIAAGTTVRVEGADALVIVALDRIDIQGNLYGNSQSSPAFFLGPGALQNPVSGNTAGVGPGGGGSGNGSSAGGGGGFCGHGGKGASSTPGGEAQGGGINGTPALVPLSAGSAGGSGFAFGGAGGGAIELVSATSIAVSGTIHVGGQGGYNGGVYDPSGNSQEASGGGSGGAILLEAPTVDTTGTLAANGGGGGQGPGIPGADATPDATAAKGGNDGMHGSLGGDGSSSSGINGEDGQVVPNTVAGGGGGAAGWIRVNSSSDSTFFGGIVSPSSICATSGSLTH